MASLGNDDQHVAMPAKQRPAKPYRLVAIDLDGTLVRHDGTLGERTQRALQAAVRQGVMVVICTGRRFRTTLPVLEQLELAMPVIVHGGQLVKDARTHETLYHNYLEKDLSLEVLKFLKAHRIPPIVYVDLFTEGTDIFVENDREGHRIHLQYLERHRLHCRFVGDVTQVFCPQTIHVGALADRAPLDEINVHLERAFGETIRHLVMNNTNDEGAFLEIMTPGNSKWRALSRLLDLEGIAAEDVICIGDEINDLEMIRHAGLGVAMGNAIPAIKAVADYITRSNEEDGVAHVIEQFVLKEMDDDAPRTHRP